MCKYRFSTTMLIICHNQGSFNLSRLTTIFSGMILVSMLVLGLEASLKVYLNYENRQLQTRLMTLKHHKDEINETLHALIQREQRMRLVTDLSDIHSDIRQVGIGGTDLSPPSMDDQAVSNRLLEDVNKLLRETQLSLASCQEIQQKAQDHQKYRRRLPSIKPVSGIMSSQFGVRMDPFTGRKRMHRGLDIAAPPGSHVWATADGVVARTGIDVNYGRYIDIDHLNGMTTRYGHLAAVFVERGLQVDRGQVIGKIGMTGRASGYHLHYEVHRFNQRIDPQLYFWPERIVVN